jgi:UDP-GlcNAc:undecaprenyl-phosphate/decaprenyl-phosphate GlcNAc-1-phosphate transferase
MSPELSSATAFAIAAVVTFVATPLMIRLAVRTAFFDVPTGYKEHACPTPYLGGAAIMAGILAAVLPLRGAIDGHGVIVACGLAICLAGTLDDRVGLPVSARTSLEATIAVLLSSTGHGWDVFHSAAADLLLTVVWVVGVANAFNMMDNMDGAAASVAVVCAIGAGVLALMSGHGAHAPLCFALAGACAAFLPRNLATPSRIFMGDGGSLLIGLLVAGVMMDVVAPGYFGPSGVIVAALLAGLVILDTTLVVVSRSRGGRPVLSGGRDHITHRLAHRLGPPRNVALALAAAQVVLCAVTIAVAQAGIGWVVLAGAAVAMLGGVLIWELEKSPWFGDGLPGAQPLSALQDVAVVLLRARARGDRAGRSVARPSVDLTGPGAAYCGLTAPPDHVCQSPPEVSSSSFSSTLPASSDGRTGSGVSPAAGLLCASIASSIWRSASDTPAPRTSAFSSRSASACSWPSATPSPDSASGRSASVTGSSIWELA